LEILYDRLQIGGSALFLRQLVSLIFTFLVFVSPPSYGDNRQITLIFPENGYAPYLMPKELGHKGIMVDVLSKALNSQGYKVAINYMPELRCHKMLEKGQGRIFPSAKEWIKTPENYVWTDPVLEVADNIITLKDSTLRLSSIGGLKGLSVGTIYQLTYPSFEPYFADGSIYRVDGRNVEQLLKMLIRGRIDALILDKNMLFWETRNNPDYDSSTFRVSEQTYDPVQYRFMVTKKTDQKHIVEAFNKGVTLMRKSDKLHKTIESYR